MKRLFLLFLIFLMSCNPIEHGDEVVGASSQSYECSSTGQVLPCLKLSSGTGTRCYLDDGAWYNQPKCSEGWVLFQEEDAEIEILPFDRPYKSGDYHCYPSKSCCIKDGSIDNPCIKI